MILTGAAVGLEALTGFKFRPDRDHTYCAICGAVFQTEVDRNPVGVYQQDPADFGYRLSNVTLYALGLRKAWSQKHGKTHSQREHQALAVSGRHYTAEAAEKLAAFGIIDILGLVLDDEIEDALNKSNATPQCDVED